MSKETVKKWLLLADGDSKTAKDEFDTENPVTNTICFHAQQCVEKYLKAFFDFRSRAFWKNP